MYQLRAEIRQGTTKGSERTGHLQNSFALPISARDEERAANGVNREMHFQKEGERPTTKHLYTVCRVSAAPKWSKVIKFMIFGSDKSTHYYIKPPQSSESKDVWFGRWVKTAYGSWKCILLLRNSGV